MAVTSPALSTRASPSPCTGIRLNLLDRLELHRGGTVVTVPDDSQRLLAYLALRGRHQHRSAVSGTLWMDATRERACAGLRAALWRIGEVGADLVIADDSYLRIGYGVRVDLAEVTDATRLLVADPYAPEEPTVTAATLMKELLPEWRDDWVILERERLHQIRLRGLEALCQRLTVLGRHAQAIGAGMSAVTAEPLRESTRGVLVSAHLAAGDVGEAVRQYDAYRQLLWQNLAIGPSERLRSLRNAWLLEYPAP